LAFTRSFETRSEAIQFEIYLKKLKNKTYIKRKFMEASG